jgi:hypothetical protein
LGFSAFSLLRLIVVACHGWHPLRLVLRRFFRGRRRFPAKMIEIAPTPVRLVGQDLEESFLAGVAQTAKGEANSSIQGLLYTTLGGGQGQTGGTHPFGLATCGRIL